MIFLDKIAKFHYNKNTKVFSHIIIHWYFLNVNRKHEFFFVKRIMEFKERIRLLRKEAGLTQAEVAEKIGVTYRTYQNYEAGASAPQSKVLAKLANVLKVSMDMLSADIKTNANAPQNDELNELLTEMKALFSGGKLREEDKKYVIEALTEAYWRTKDGRKGTS